MAMTVGPTMYATAQDSPIGQPSPLEGKVLIVDNDSSLRRALHTALYGSGFGVGEALSGEEAIALCRVVRYDAVLLNVSRSSDSGIETGSELLRLLPRVAILMLSTDDDRDQRIEALETVADDYLIKPLGYAGTDGANSRRAAGTNYFTAQRGNDHNRRSFVQSGAPPRAESWRARSSDAEGIRPPALSYGEFRSVHYVRAAPPLRLGRAVFHSDRVSSDVCASIAPETRR